MMNNIFKEKNDKIIEIYMDYMIVKSIKEEKHNEHLLDVLR